MEAALTLHGFGSVPAPVLVPAFRPGATASGQPLLMHYKSGSYAVVRFVFNRLACMGPIQAAVILECYVAVLPGLEPYK
jgi:hypothetical protein